MRRRLALLLAVCAVLGISHFLYWRYAQRQLVRGFEHWIANAERHGWHVAARTAAGGGWPLAARLDLSDVTVSGGTAPPVQDIVWQIPTVSVAVALIAPQRLDLEFRGDQRIRVRAAPEYAIRSTQLQVACYGAPNGGPISLDLTATQLRLSPVGSGPHRELMLGALEGHLDLTTPGDSVPFTVTGTDLELPPGERWPLGPTVRSFTLEGVATGNLASGATPAEWAQAWRDSGGSSEVRRLAVEWGPLAITATATVALDEQLQPMGAGNAKLVGYPAALDTLARNGALSRSAATAAKAVLSLLAPAPGSGDQDEVEVPLTLQYRTLSIRQIPLLRLPELDWDRH